MVIFLQCKLRRHSIKDSKDKHAKGFSAALMVVRAAERSGEGMSLTDALRRSILRNFDAASRYAEIR